MDTHDFADKGQAMADKAADKIQSGIRGAKQTAESTASNLSERVESVRSNVGPTLGSAADRANRLVSRGVNAVSGATQRARDTFTDTQDSVVAYTQENPVKALMIAAAAGAVLVTLLRVLSPARD